MAQGPGGEHAPQEPSSIAGLEPVGIGRGQRVRVVATTSLVGDVLARVGGDSIQLTVLVPIGADPHAYMPTPQDLSRVQDGHVVFINGLGLEGPLLADLAAAAPGTPIVSLSEGLEPRLQSPGAEAEAGQGGTPSGVESGREAEGAADPHVWFDPRNVQQWARNAAGALSALDPDRADRYQERARSYVAELEQLDAWIQEQVDSIPDANRMLVTDHLVFGYFSDRYGFEMIGAVIPAYSSLAEPSARSFADLEQLVAERGVKAVFVGLQSNAALAERVAQDLNVPVVPLYVGSLSEPGGPADSYLELMRFDVQRIVEVLS